ncbi:MAG: serine/threonine protein kinase [Myxococcales bacterium]|nr:serine/threonine protein kinase [Myxococcales bacterium]
MATRKARLRAALFDEAVDPLRFGRYVVLGTLGRGGMGTVLEAFDRSLDRRVALKVLHHDVAESQGRRLIREAQALAKLSHPNVVQVYEVGEVEGRLFVAMELVDGQDLHRWAQCSPRPGWRECVEVYLQAGAGLAAAHAKGLVHRDFKPSNAIRDHDGRVRVLDFGLARRVLGAESEQRSTDPAIELPLELQDSELNAPLTEGGAVLGTPAYMPPEQMRGEEVDARGDQFGFCVALYEAISGTRPFEGTSIPGLILSMSAGVRALPLDVRVPARVQQVLARGLAFAPERRWPSMDVLLEQLQRLLAPRRAGLRLGLGLAVVLAGTGAGLGYYAGGDAPEPPCQAARQRIAGVWDDARRKEVGTAILGTGLAYAPDTWQRVEARLDEYAEAWVAEHQEVCEATRVHADQTEEVMTLRMECLDGRRRELRATVDVLAKADEMRVRKAVELVEGLPRLDRCDDVEALRAALPPPEDPAVAKQVEAERERLAEADVLSRAGAYERSEELTTQVVQQAEALGYGPLLAEALESRASAHRGRGEFDLAVRDLERGHLLAVELRHESVALMTANALAFVVGERQARFEPGHLWGTLALAMARRPGTPSSARASVLINIGALLNKHGDGGQALEHYRRALAIKEGLPNPPLIDIAKLLNNIGIILDERGEHEQALESYQRSLAMREQALGPRHPVVAETASNIGVALALRGEHELALAHFERALSIDETILGPRHPSIAIALNNVGMVLAMQGEHQRAEVFYQRALSIMEEALGPADPAVGQILVGMADLALSVGDHPGARENAERAVLILEAQAIPLALAEARFVLGRALWFEPSQQSRARALVEQAHDLLVERPAESRELLDQAEAWLADHDVP